MKHTSKRVLALFMALLLAMPTVTFAEEPAGELMIVNDAIIESEPLPELEVETELDGAGEIPLTDLSDALSGGTLLEDAPQGEAVDAVAYCFIVDDTLYVTQVAGEGGEIIRPADPDAPEGYALYFLLWEDAEPLFILTNVENGAVSLTTYVVPSMELAECSTYAQLAMWFMRVGCPITGAEIRPQ